MRKGAGKDTRITLATFGNSNSAPVVLASLPDVSNKWHNPKDCAETIEWLAFATESNLD